MPLNMHSNNRPKFLSFALKTLSASVASAVLLSSAHAAGLGKLTVLSALGQPLSAEIELTSVSPDELGSIVAKLAPVDAYKQANIDFNPTLLSLRFAVDKRGNRQFIRISSTQPVNEPFVDMLLEVGSSSGRIVREYTFLLDPVGLNTSPAQVSGNEAVAVSKPAATTATSTVAVTDSVKLAPPKKPAKASKPERPVPVEKAATLEKPAAAEKPASSESNAAGSYEVKKGDTLGKIAAQTKVSGVSLDQMLAALYRANTNAFIGNNMNRLRSGQILNVPDADSVKAISQGEARSLVVAQSADFSGYRNKLAGQVEAANATKVPEIKQGTSGKITTKVEQPATAADKSQDKLKLSKSLQGNASASALGMSNEEKIAKDKAIAEANARVKELERNINELNKVVELKNKALAEKVAKANVPAPAPAPAPTPAPAPAPAPVKPAPEPAPEAAPAKPASASASVSASAPASVPPVAAPVQPEAVPAPATPPKRKIVIPPPPPPPEPTLMDTLMENLLPIGGIAGLLAGGVGYFLYRRRQQAEQPKFESSMLNESGLQANSMFGQTGGQSVDTNNSVFNSNFAPSASQLDTNEVDPVAEADVYIAYGRDVQAEEILKEALRTQPERNAVRLKLLEIYASRKDTRAFEVQAGELYAITQGEGEDWAQAASLGMTIDPNNPMYAGGDAGHSAKASTPLHASTEPLDDLDPEAMLVSTQQPRTPVQDSLEDDFNFDLPADAADQLSSLDLDLSPASAPAAPVEDDFDFGIKEAVEPAPAPSEAPEPAEEDHILDFDLGGLTFKPNAPAAPAAPVVPAADLVALDKMMDAGLNTDFNETAKFSLDDLPRDLPSEAVAAVPAPQDDLDLSDFNLEASALPEMDMDFGIAPEVAAPAPAAPEAEDMKFDLDDMDFGIAEPDPDATIVARSPDAAPEALSLPDLDLPPVASENDEFADMLADLPDLDDSFMVPDVPSAPVGESAMAPAEAHAAPMANDFDMSSIDLDLNSASDAADSGQSSIDNLDGLGDLDDLNELNEGDEMSSVQVEMDTKLDLAVAYQEIGDKEGARELIDEVIKGGSPDQVEKAKAMRAKLA